MNPLIKAPAEVATGRDMYRHRAIVPDSMKKASPEQQYTDVTPEVFKKLADAMPDVTPEVFRSPLILENMTKNMTAGLITQFLPRKPVEGRGSIENTPLLQRFQALPFTDRKQFNDQIRELERNAADDYLTRHRKAIEVVNRAKTEGLSPVLREVAKQTKDPKLIQQAVDLWIAEKNGVTGDERRILALPVEQRAQYIASQLKSASPEEKTAIIRNYARKRILTEGVAAPLAELLKP
jgi:hypothetical protein